MYTILWIENGANKWIRTESSQEANKILAQLKSNPDVKDNKTWVLTPSADDCIFNLTEFENIYERKDDLFDLNC